MKPIFKRSQPLQVRFILGAIGISLSIIIADSYFNSFSNIKICMDSIISPFYVISNSSHELLDSVLQLLSSQSELKRENKELKQELVLKNSELLLLRKYKQENARLYELLGSPLLQNEQKMITKVLATTSNPYKDQIIIDKGSINGVYEGQPVISDKGVVGQVIAVSKLTSRVLLICDVTHALPIQVLRNDIRVIITGMGCMDNLQLELLPVNIDIQVGDILVTSGVDGRFPAGYPVAIVTSVKLDTKRSHTVVLARPIANLRYLHYLLLLWNTDSTNTSSSSSIAPKEIRRIANERLMCK